MLLEMEKKKKKDSIFPAVIALFILQYYVHRQLQLLLSFLIVCLDFSYSNNVEKNKKYKEKGFGKNPDMNRETSGYNFIHMISFF